jgi:hypothetical protein
VPQATPAKDANGAKDAREPEGETQSERYTRKLGRTWGYVALSAGGIGALVAVGTSVLMLDSLHQRNEDCNGKTCSSDGLSANSSLSQNAPWNVAAWALTAVGLSAGIYLLIANPPDKASDDITSGIGLAPVGSGAGLSARGSF